MTNPEMVKDPKGGARPEPNRAPPTPVPAPEGDPRILTTEDPPDSPQPNPMINPPKTAGLRKPRD
ncbi:MAG TPA: hypothetical protein VF601_16170 [Beijerinckiaceae bacterium]|jgi:hypothetical protein